VHIFLPQLPALQTHPIPKHKHKHKHKATSDSDRELSLTLGLGFVSFSLSLNKTVLFPFPCPKISTHHHPNWPHHQSVLKTVHRSTTLSSPELFVESSCCGGIIYGISIIRFSRRKGFGKV
jgi:hypothetical protein